MKYTAVLNGKRYEVEVQKEESQYFPMTREEISRGGSGGPAAPIVMAAPVVPVAPAPPPAAAAPAPVAPPPPVQAAQPTAAPAPAPAGAGAVTVRAPMPGNIMDIKVTPGQAVKAGHVLLTMEAMKMENDIVAPVDGTVQSISVQKADTVDTDDVLVMLG